MLTNFHIASFTHDPPMLLCCLTASGALCDARGGRTMKDAVCAALRLHLSVHQSAYLQWRETGSSVKRASCCWDTQGGKTGPDSGRPVSHLSFSCGRKFHVSVKVQTRRKPLRVFLGVIGTEPVPSCPVPCLTHHHNRKSSTGVPRPPRHQMVAFQS